MTTCRKCVGEFVGDRCKVCARAYDAKYRAAHREIMNQKCAAYHAAHALEIGQRKRAYRVANASSIKSYLAKHHSENPEKRRARFLAWHAANPNAARSHHANRRARLKANGGQLSAGIADRLFALQRGQCACCGAPLGDDFHLDHIVPIVLGGENEDRNMQLLTQRCNNQKHAKHPVDFMQSRGFLL